MLNDETREQVIGEMALLSKTRFVPGDVLVYRGPLLERGEIEALRGAAPKGTALVVLQPGVELEALPEDDARRLYAHLHTRFGGGR